MYNLKPLIFKIIFSISTFLLFSISLSNFSFIIKTEAEETCVVESANFSPSGTLPNFLESGGNISISVKTINCEGKKLLLTVFGTHEYYIGKSSQTGQMSSPLTVSNLSNRSIDVPDSNNFKINLIAKEESCAGRDSYIITNNETYYSKYDCAYYFELKGDKNFSSQSTSGGGIIYNCSGECEDQFKPWSFISVTSLENNTGSNPGTGVENSEVGVGVSPVKLNFKVDNPISSGIDTIPKFIEAILHIILVIATPIVAFAIIYTGFLFIKAQGNSDMITKAKKALLYTIIGAVLLLGAFLLASAIGSSINEIKG